MASSALINLGSFRYGKPADIILLRGRINYTDIYFSNGEKLTVATTLKVLEGRLSPGQGYCRTHKSFLINLQYFHKISVSNRLPVAEMQNGLLAQISRRKMPSLKFRLLK